MNWVATTRYELEPAPGGLASVQDFMNTRSTGKPPKPDLLADLGAARQWLAESGLSPSDGVEIVLEDPDLRHLRKLRDDLLPILVGHTDGTADLESLPTATMPLSVTLSVDGGIRLTPRGSGWKALASRLLVAMYDAQHAHNWERLKSCRNPECRGVFYDRSRNNSGVWHNVHTCGNAANLRASRARRRPAAATA